MGMYLSYIMMQGVVRTFRDFGTLGVEVISNAQAQKRDGDLKWNIWCLEEETVIHAEKAAKVLRGLYPRVSIVNSTSQLVPVFKWSKRFFSV